MEEAFGADLYRDLDFHQVCQNLYDGIHITDGEGVILFINAPASGPSRCWAGACRRLRGCCTRAPSPSRC